MAWESAGLLPWRGFEEGILLLLLTLPWQPCQAQQKSSAPCFLWSENGPLFLGNNAQPKKLTLAKCSSAPLEKVPGTNSLAASHPALAAMSGTAQKFCSLLSVVSKINPSALQSLRAQKSHFGKVQHSSHKEGTRKKFSCCSHPALEAM